MIKLASAEQCTACGACAFRCPHGCITMSENATGVSMPTINASLCIECGACVKACPALNEVPFDKPEEVWAAWSDDAEQRRTSASGGIAAEMYKLALKRGWQIVGASQNADLSVTHKLTAREKDISGFKNSKYVESSVLVALPEIKAALSSGSHVLFVGLPCQTAALRRLFPKSSNLLLADVICHGVTPLTYLRQHVKTVCTASDADGVQRMSFRDPACYTYTFTFTLYDRAGRQFYAKRTKDGDTYNYGYHRAVSYRENCYHCKYARLERPSDITLADYSGLGLAAPCSYSSRKVSMVLTNTVAGKQFFDALRQSGAINADARPVEEPAMGQGQMRRPSPKTKYRLMFEADIVRYGGDFEKAIARSLSAYNRDSSIKAVLHFPRRMLGKIKRLLIGKR